MEWWSTVIDWNFIIATAWVTSNFLKVTKFDLLLTKQTKKWYFSVQDVVQALTDTVDAKDYIKKMKKRESSLNINWGTICPLVEMVAADGKKRKVQAVSVQGVCVLYNPFLRQK